MYIQRTVLLLPCRILVLLLLVGTDSSSLADDQPTLALTIPEEGVIGKRRDCSWLAVSQDKEWIAARFMAAEDRERVCLWSRRDLKPLNFTIKCTSSTGTYSHACAIDQTNNAILYADDHAVYSYSLKAGKSDRLFALPSAPGEQHVHRAVTLVGDKKLAVFSVIESSKVRLETTSADEKDRRIEKFEARGDLITSSSLDRDGSRCVVGYTTMVGERREHVVEVWDTKRGVTVFTDRSGKAEITATAISNDGAFVCAGSADGSVTLWDLRKGTRKGFVENYTVSSIDFRPGDKFLVYTTFDRRGKRNARIVDVSSGACAKELNVDMYGAKLARFSADGNELITVGGECVIRLWNIKDVVAK